MMSVEMLGPAAFRHSGRVIGLRPLEKVIHMAVYVAGGRLSMARLVEDVWTVPTPGSAATLRGCLSKARAKVVAAGGTAEHLSRTIKVCGGQSVVSLPDNWDVDVRVFQQRAADAGKERRPPPLARVPVTGASSRARRATALSQCREPHERRYRGLHSGIRRRTKPARLDEPARHRAPDRATRRAAATSPDRQRCCYRWPPGAAGWDWRSGSGRSARRGSG